MMLGIHWIPTNVSHEDMTEFASWKPPFIKVVTIDEKVPYLEYVPQGTMIVVRNHPMSELFGERFLQASARVQEDPETLQARYIDYFRWFIVRNSSNLARMDSRMMASEENNAEAVGREHADICNRMAAYCESQGVGRGRLLFEGLNEPQLWASEPPYVVARYYKAFLSGLHQFGLHGVVGNFGVGWPGNGGSGEAPQWEFFRPVIQEMHVGDYLGLHEYWAFEGAGQLWGWWGGRFTQCPYEVPILITECGIDGGVIGRPYKGWRSLPGPLEAAAKRYVDELWWYAQQGAKDGRVKGIFPFTYDSASWEWQDFDIRHGDLRTAFHAKLAAEGLPRPGLPTDEEEIPVTENVDPRDPNCRGVHVDSTGKVDGVLLTVLPTPPGKYICKQVSLIDEAAAAGQTTCQVVVVDKAGIPVLGTKVYLAWPWDGVSTTFQEKALPGNTNYPPNHVITNGYDANKVQGPLAIFIGDNAGNIDSEVVAGLGLPWNRHVSYTMLFQEGRRETDPVYGSLIEALAGEAEKADLLQVNPNAALCKAGAERGLWPTSNEFPVQFGDVQYVAQRFRNPMTDMVYVLYCVLGQYDRVMQLNYIP